MRDRTGNVSQSSDRALKIQTELEVLRARLAAKSIDNGHYRLKSARLIAELKRLSSKRQRYALT